MAGINSLPNELEKIFIHIPISKHTDVNQLQNVCKKWRFVLKNKNLQKALFVAV